MAFAPGLRNSQFDKKRVSSLIHLPNKSFSAFSFFIAPINILDLVCSVDRSGVMSQPGSDRDFRHGT